MIRSERRIPLQILALALALTLLLPALLHRSQAAGEEQVTSAEARNQTVRVYLSRLGIVDRMDITLLSPYGLEPEGGQPAMHFAKGSELSILLKSGSLYVYYQGMAMNAGSRLALACDAELGEEKGFRVTNYPALYAGDLRLDVVEEKIRPILSIHVEDYLLGVVPYEMNNAFPLEALKAQAVTARTYALKKQGRDGDYDVVDTTNDQVYKGYVSGAEQVEKAVRETRGICGFYQGKLAQCYYAASNGGQTALPSTVWPGDPNDPCYAVSEDKYDVENPASTVKTLKIQRKYEKDEVAPYGLRRLLAEVLASELVSRGLDPAPESVRVDAVSDVSVDTPVANGSMVLSMLRLTLSISGRTRQSAPVVLKDLDTEEVRLFTAPQTPAPTPALSAETGATPEPSPSPTPAPIYGPFTPIEQSFSLDVPIFPTAERAFALGISSNFDNELWTVVKSEDSFAVQSRRFGHGVGMSQRGAEWMAARYQKTYQEILAFYYPGMELRRFEDMADVAVKPDEALRQTAGPPPTPTPRPTLMPVTQEAGEGQWFALVTGIDTDSTLNLRSAPDMGGDVLMRLSWNQRLLVLERCPEDGWVKVRTDAIEGYVMEKFLSRE